MGQVWVFKYLFDHELKIIDKILLKKKDSYLHSTQRIQWSVGKFNTIF